MSVHQLFDKINIKAAAQEYSKFDLSSDTLMTFDFGQMAVVNVIDNIMGDKIRYDYRLFGRTAPNVFPTFADMGQRSILVFVPYYQIADDADAYIEGLQYYAGRPAVGRFFYQKELDIFFYGPFYSSTNGGSSGATWDYLRVMNADEIKSYNELLPASRPLSVFTVSDGNGKTNYLRLTHKGKVLYNLLRGLGYTINRSIVFAKTTDTVGSKNGNVVLNAYPLLCYLKAYSDLLTPTAFYQTSALQKCLHSIKSLSTSDNFVDSSGFIKLSNMRSQIQSALRVYYDSDYFTSAWQSTNSPLSSTITSVTEFSDINNQVDAFADKDGNKLDLLANGSTVQLSQTQLNFLKGFDSFVRRNNLVGYREFNAVYARFGIKPSELKSNYCKVLLKESIPVNTGDVTATAQTEDTLLGSYAGKSFQNAEHHMEYEAQDHGMLLHLTSLYVKPMYFQGTAKHCLRNNTYDFYKPEFDGVGPAAISRLELNGQLEDTVYGYTERYNEYRFQQSKILGDFELDPTMWPWHAGRYFSNTLTPTAQTDNMLMYTTDAAGNNEFDRIFSTQNVDNPFDHFYQTWQFRVSALRKMKNRNEALGLGVGEVKLDANGSM